MKKLILSLSALALSAPAFAMGTPPVIPPNPVTDAMQQARTAKYNAFHTCIGARFHEPAVLADTAKFEQANKDAGWAAAYRDLPRYNTVMVTFDAELGRLKAAYGC